MLKRPLILYTFSYNNAVPTVVVSQNLVFLETDCEAGPTVDFDVVTVDKVFTFNLCTIIIPFCILFSWLTTCALLESTVRGPTDKRTRARRRPNTVRENDNFGFAKELGRGTSLLCVP